MASIIWDDEMRYLFFTAYYRLRDDVRGNEELRGLARRAPARFAERFLSRPAHTAIRDIDAFLQEAPLLDGQKELVAPSPFDEAAIERALQDDLISE